MNGDRQKLVFRNRIATESQRVLIYEDTQLQAKAKLCIPLSTLVAKAEENCSTNSNRDKDLKDALLIELLGWFKQDFFTWFDAPCCGSCQQNMTAIGMADPNPEDIKYEAFRVEKYRCRTCNTTDKFPRYNDPGSYFSCTF